MGKFSAPSGKQKDFVLTNLLFFSGSSQIGSVNWRLASAAADLTKRAFGADVAVTVVDLSVFELPNYDAGHQEADRMPSAAVTLKETITRNDGIFMSSDEYTGAYSSLLKNAIGWLTHNLADKETLFDGALIALCGASLRGLGGLRGHPALHQMLAELGATVISQHLELGTSPSPFDSGGNLLPKVEKQLLDGALKSLFVEATIKQNSRRASHTLDIG
jgi:chromate reductase